jgi:nucleotide-binding universal stress UspA family protein
MDIWVGFDGSDGSERALMWAGRVAERTGACVRPVNAWQMPALSTLGGPPFPDPSILERRAREQLELSLVEARQPLPDGVEVKPLELHQVDPVELLTSIAKPDDLLVVGSRGLGPAARLVLGSVASRVASHASSAFAVVPRDWWPRADEAETPVALVAVDTTPVGQLTVHWAARHLPDHQLRLLHVWDSPFGESLVYDVLGDGDYLAERQAQKHLDRAVRIAHSDLGDEADIDSALVEGSPVAVIVEATEDADVLVMGAQRHRGLKRLLLGSVSQGVIHDLRIPTIIVPEEAY